MQILIFQFAYKIRPIILFRLFNLKVAQLILEQKKEDILSVFI